MTAPNASTTRSTGRIAHRPRRALVALAIGAGAVIGLSACSAGQISQTSGQTSAVNGTWSNVGPLGLRDVQIVYPAGDVKPGDPAARANLTMTITNGDANSSDRLTGVTVTGADATILDADRAIVPAGQTLIAASPLAPAPAAEENPPVHIQVSNMAPTIRPGLTVPVTVTFQRAGAVNMTVPINAAAPAAQGNGGH